MAAQKKKDQKFPQASFEIPVEDAVADLIHPSERALGDQWHFQVQGAVLVITRIRPPENQ